LIITNDDPSYYPTNSIGLLKAIVSHTAQAA